jgi:hypothetical protein
MAFHISVAKRYDRADPIKSLCPETRLADIDAIWLFYRSNSRKWVSFRHCSVTARDVALPRNIAAEPKEPRWRRTDLLPTPAWRKTAGLPIGSP